MHLVICPSYSPCDICVRLDQCHFTVASIFLLLLFKGTTGIQKHISPHISEEKCRLCPGQMDLTDKDLMIQWVISLSNKYLLAEITKKKKKGIPSSLYLFTFCWQHKAKCLVPKICPVLGKGTYVFKETTSVQTPWNDIHFLSCS